MSISHRRGKIVRYIQQTLMKLLCFLFGMYSFYSCLVGLWRLEHTGKARPQRAGKKKAPDWRGQGKIFTAVSMAYYRWLQSLKDFPLMATSDMPLLTKQARAERKSGTAMSAKYMILTQLYRRKVFFMIFFCRFKEIQRFKAKQVFGGQQTGFLALWFKFLGYPYTYLL